MRINEAVEEAKRRLSEDFNEENFLRLLSSLLIMGDMRTLKRYINLWKELKGKFTDRFTSYLALYYYHTLNIKKLRELFPKLHPVSKSLVSLNVWANVRDAIKYAHDIEDEFARDRIFYQIATLMGKPYPEPRPRSEYEEVIVSWTRVQRLLYTGRIDRALEELVKVVEDAVERGTMQVVLSFKLNEALIKGRISDVKIIRMALSNLGLRRLQKIAETYERFLGNRSLKFEDEEISYLNWLNRISNYYDNAVNRRFNSLNENLFGLEAFWWYMANIKFGRVYLSFSGRLRLMKGVKEIKLPRRKALMVLAYYKIAGENFLKENAHLLFPESSAPKRRVVEYMRYIKEYLQVPTDLAIALRSKTFLEEERESWSLPLKRRFLKEL